MSATWRTGAEADQGSENELVNLFVPVTRR